MDAGPPARGLTVPSQPSPSDTLELGEILTILASVRKGDFSVRMPTARTGLAGKVADTLNEIIELNQQTALELERVSLSVGKEGRITQRAHLSGAGGAWSASINSVNTLIGDLVQPTSEVARVIGAVARGDLSQTMGLDIEGRPLMGEFLRIGKTVNSMVDQLSSFASEVTRVAREVGTEGKLGGQARVKGVGGTWKDLTDNVNSMAGNLTAQVRNIAQVTTAVANGDLSKKITVDVKGEILELKNTINTMVDQLNSFASEVTRVAREVGTEGNLGGQAPGEGRGRYLERPDRQREFDGRQPHRPGPEHRAGDHRGGERRPLQEDHRRRQGRNPGAQEHHQHHGGPAQLLRLRSDPRRPGGRHRRQAGRPGPGEGRGRHLERPDRQRQLDGQQPDRPGA
jgi:HAMP domain-containing protein